MELSGVISDGMIKLDEPCTIPDGTKVTVLVTLPGQDPGQDHSDASRAGLGKRLLKHAGTVSDLPADLAEQHDHYIHGTPKR